MMTDTVVQLDEWRSRERFECAICRKRPTKLMSVKLSKWRSFDPAVHSAEAYERYQEATTLRTQFICKSCFCSFHFKPGFGHSFYAYQSEVYRLSVAKNAVEYDITKWRSYIRRYRCS